MQLRIVPLMILLLAAPSVARASGEGVPDKGFLLQVGLGASNVSPTLAYPALTAGYRLIDRLEIRLALSFLATGSTGNAAGTTSGVGGYFVVTPGISVDLMKFLNSKVAFTGVAGLPLGAGFGGGTSTFVIGFNVGLGIRYAIVPVFTVGFEGGVLGLFNVSGTAAGAVGAGTAVGFYGALAGTLYFGK